MQPIVAHEFVDISISDLKPAKFNPTRRTLPKNLAGLMGSIAQNGMPVPIVITEDYEVGDGHRRLACAKNLGWEKVPVVVWRGKTSEEIWSILNAHQMNMTPAQWLEAVVCGMSIEQPEIPRRLANLIREMVDTLDDEMIWRIVEDGRSPDILSTAKFVNRKIGRDDTGESLAKTVKWLLDYSASFKVRQVISGDYDLEVIAECIDEGRDFDFEIVPK